MSNHYGYIRENSRGRDKTSLNIKLKGAFIKALKADFTALT